MVNTAKGVCRLYKTGGVVAEPVERATPGQEGVGAILDLGARSLLVGLVST